MSSTVASDSSSSVAPRLSIFFITSLYPSHAPVALLRPFKIILVAFNTSLEASIYGSAKLAPILDRAAFVLSRAPWNVSFALVACSPKASSIACAKVAKSISPCLTISETAASDTPRCFARTAEAFIPLKES